MTIISDVLLEDYVDLYECMVYNLGQDRSNHIST